MTLDYPVPFHTPNLVWDYTIAIYLFLLGISSGAVQLAIAYKRSNKLESLSQNWIIRSGVILGSVPTLIGLTLLIFHLTRPWTFWKLMFNYQFNSVMSMGVMLFQIYMLFLVIWGVVIFKKEIEALINRFIPKLQFVMKLIGIAERITSPVEVILFILAAVLGAYTGFLLSALISYPMLNNPVLPALFLASGTSSGIAATFLIILIAGKLKGDSHESHFIHKFEVPIMVTELGLIVCFFVGLHFGGGQKTVALHNALSGFWGAIFWVGVLIIGILIPLIANMFVNDRLKYNRNFIILVSIFDLIGVFCLRFFVLYAGQLTVA
ncbi:NrfD, formate-dependent nitrite reductase, membrane component [Haemophilus influenzae 3655]|uniref:Cytochrome c nitrite reductase subunit NrfD n=1 Tax=Haemophilus influenzae (strain NTHi 3655) TaxID=375177 RepID=A0A0H3PF40_HAEI3|nr:cytochrome c nitrite reductase subunit NrfD [Haemophilus influenzae]EDJ93866.1 NrfD, formate-dependent nitrite reductase, membrane component [Haemophilus influenzae 3655]KOR03288.1 nitrite reductase [Haemophilus influenzae]MCC3182080.1 cytochrome c nitrite reductase subunit NrfD [Haemophilus influenzae]MCK8841844.1 cytochrome c nitrite reductase subunit NrfD [Haemophilus influenzae]MCK8918468.1 cytochrome c nitrite reductase subunit NrfD [Haemophilus influenzae]